MKKHYSLYLLFLLVWIGLSNPLAVRAASYSDVVNYLNSNPAPDTCVNWINRIANDHYDIRQRCGNWPKWGLRYAVNGIEQNVPPESDPITVMDCHAAGSYVSTRQYYQFYSEITRLYLCDNTYYDTASVPLSYPFGSPLNGITDPCFLDGDEVSGIDYKDCNGSDVLADFYPVELCYDELNQTYTGCGSGCSDPANGGTSHEIFGNGIDDNCDGIIDNNLPPAEEEICDGIDNNNNGVADETCIGTSEKEKASNEPEAPDTDMCVGSVAKISNGNLNQDQYITPDFAIYYNSLFPTTGPLGNNWTHSYSIKISDDNGTNLVLTQESGTKTYFWHSNNAYYPEIRVPEYSYIEKNGDGSYTRFFKKGTVQNFNASGQLTSIVDRNGNITSLAYANGNLTSITDPKGRVTTLANDGSRITNIFSVHNNGTSLSYDSDGNLRSITDSTNHSWSFTYDSNGRMLTKADPAGNMTTYTYDGQGRMTESLDADGKRKEISYDPANITATITERDGGVWVYKYDPVLDVVIEMKDPLNFTTYYQYDAGRNITRITNPDGHVSRFQYDSFGNMTSQTDELGQVTEYTYNNFGQVLTERDVASNTTITYNYDVKGNLTSIVDAAGITSAQFEYDLRGNLTKIKDAALKETTLVYDANGNNLMSVTDPGNGITGFTYDTAGRPLSQTDAAGAVTQFEYDSLGRLTTVTQPGNAVTLFGYDANGNVTSITDANNRITTYTYNSHNLVTSETNALNQQTTYTYGGTGCGSCGGGVNKLTTLTDARNNATNFTYNKFNRVLTETDPLGKTTSYTYHSYNNYRGNLSSRTDANGNRTDYAYDSLNRLIRITYPDLTTVTYQYDSKDRVTSAANQHIAYNFTYDANGRVTSVVDSNSRTISYAYDSRGNRTRMTTPDGRVIDYTYDDDSRLTQITQAGQVFTFAYDTADRRTNFSYPNGVTANYTYDTRSRLTGIEYKNSGNTVFDAFAYTVDAVGNRMTRTDNEYQSTYTYDSTYRLTESQPLQAVPSPLFSQTVESFSYDAVGNRSTGPAYPKVASYTQSYAYDYENRIVSATKQVTGNPNADIVTFKYDPFGRRVEKNVSTFENGVTTTYKYTYVYDNEDIILEVLETTQNGNTTTTTTAYTHGPGIDEPLSLTRDGQSYYYHADGLGSITSITDSAEAVVNRYAYDTFGALKSEETVRNAYAYTGREYDSETGLFYYRARYYDPETGRFISKDPLGLAAEDVNVYGYVGNNPILLTDPEGLYYDKAVKILSWLFKKGIQYAKNRAKGEAGRRIDKEIADGKYDPQEEDTDNDGIPNFMDPESEYCNSSFYAYCKKQDACIVPGSLRK